MKRLFFALWPDEAVRKALAGCTTQVLGRHARPVHHDDVHMTLQFLGNVPAQRLPDLEASAAAVIAPEVKLRLTRLGCWPKPQVVWCAPDETPVALTRLVKELGEVLTDVGYPPERRVYRPHVTLARKVRSMREARLAAPIAWTSREFVLVESRAAAEPPRYRVVARWGLRPAKSNIGE